ncbi:hypothetical protein WMY93_005593 [Mugilogobius chulae]|uniref:DUF5641 domain-containing protein n=1 Tax=Mugilogobius chulae TaxID=88201 RepID=A0AAW0PH81_9GOBI
MVHPLRRLSASCRSRGQNAVSGGTLASHESANERASGGDEQVRLTSHTQSAFARPSYPYRYTADQPQYSSLPQLERVSPLQCLSPTDISAPLYPPGPVTRYSLHSYGLQSSLHLPHYLRLMCCILPLQWFQLQHQGQLPFPLQCSQLHALQRGIIQSGSDRTYTLPDLAEWLERKVQTLQVSHRISTSSSPSTRPATTPFLWRDGEKERSPDVYEWRVLPFGTTCSPCCAIYALQRHAQDFREGNEDVVNSVLQAFYVDNCLQSLPSTEQAKQLIDRLRAVLGTGGFDIRQWSCNVPDVISHLPAEAKSVSCELWLSAHKEEPVESTLGLMWNCSTDTLSYRHRDIPPAQPTLRYVYRVLASQYDPLGFLIPYTTRAKMLVQVLWKKGRDWDEPITDELLPVWQAWESELSQLHQVIIPRRYTSEIPASNNVELHIFTDASERAYGAVAYLRTEDVTGAVKVSFVLARSRVAPKKQLSIPRLELCAALSGAQLAKLLQTELTLPIKATTLWTDSTTVLHWIQSESQQYKVFVGTRVAEIQELVGAHHWRYIPSSQNAADDITRGKSLSDLIKPSRWTCGPDFLYQPESEWPTKPIATSTPEEPEEVRDLTFCGNIVTATPAPRSKSWSDLIQATYLAQHGAAAPPMTATDRLETEVFILKRAQEESFPAEVAALQAGKPLQTNSRLVSLCPEYDRAVGLIRVGGRLRKAEGLQDTIHPIVLAPDHPTTRLLIQHCDNQLLHPGPDRVFAEMRRTYWILRGRQAVKKYQRSCTECQRWRNKPTVPQVEGILNSKPLGYASSDIADPDPITPNLLLMGRRDASLPQAVYRSSDLIGRRRWKHSQVLADHFWAQFTRNYLPNLHQRRKWQTHTPDLSTGQVVMVIDPLLPRARWPIGRVVNVIPSDDGRIRAAEVDIKGTIYTRPVAKLISLPEMPED